jgi:hypothetical protein
VRQPALAVAAAPSLDRPHHVGTRRRRQQCHSALVEVDEGPSISDNNWAEGCGPASLDRGSLPTWNLMTLEETTGPLTVARNASGVP